MLFRSQASGILKVDLSEIRDWPPVGAGSRLSFLVWMDRAASGGNAAIDQITISYGTEAKAVVGTEVSIGTLAFEPAPFSIQYDQQFDVIQFSSNHKQLIERGTKLRRRTTLPWGVLSAADTGTLNSFLISGMNTHFDWQPYTEPASLKWKVQGTPQIRQAGIKDYYQVTAQLVEYLP